MSTRSLWWAALMTTFLVSYLLVWQASNVRQQMQPPVAPAPELRPLTAADGYDPLATYDPKERILVITDRLPADALICIGGHCGLPASWQHLAPEHWKESGQ